ncbi:2Fe-2S iron-sulfur cluster binding domain-containing protein [Motilimonas cestriensis]|uniref:2Fe-2S iron-sulfur cluster binding domain-containing protein n=1 Tax=Motilimonas cestriensis TaxID=2742685 RepID=A0ABS8W6J5_9GAMM|nr:2Fe-2S iron-sulfur cluster-binding protein [Motilimonas cestriensis]MCE2593895.1 2Fe-2S iron-sulfur cluster binding domain-containing protein [Motilimonas cestriensis]
MFKARLLPDGVEFDINEHETILAAAIRQKIPFPYRCRTGGCQSCLCQRTQGEVEYGAMEPWLTDAEQAEGWTYACLAKPLTDLEIKL